LRGLDTNRTSRIAFWTCIAGFAFALVCFAVTGEWGKFHLCLNIDAAVLLVVRWSERKLERSIRTLWAMEVRHEVIEE
jgi:hypothetical protein